jgi:hypothetical protein
LPTPKLKAVSNAVKTLLLLTLLAAAAPVSGVFAQEEGARAVESIFRFSGGEWIGFSHGNPIENDGAVSKLGANAFTVYGGGVDISFTGVYTEGGEMYEGFYWAYLYDASGKIGIAVNEDGDPGVMLGKTVVDYTSEFLYMINTKGMQDAINGLAYKE